MKLGSVASPSRRQRFARAACVLFTALLAPLPIMRAADTVSAGAHFPDTGDAALFALMEKQESGWWNLKFADGLRAHPRFVSSRNAAGETPLHVAARRALENETFLLLLAGADANATDAQGRTPLHLIAGQNREDAWMIRDMLVIKNANLKTVAGNGMTPLMVAAQAGDLRTIEFLLWMGVPLGAHPTGGQPSPRELALANGHDDAAALLADAETQDVITLKTQPKQIPPYVARAFTDAAAKKDYALLCELMAEGVDINTPDDSGATALHRAVYRAHEDVVTFLLMLGADPNLTNNRGDTPYMSASSWFGLSMDWMRAMLVLAGSQADRPVNQAGLSPLGAVAQSGNEQSAQMLIWSGADPRVEAGTEGTPMRIACRAGSQRIVDLLRRNGVTEPEFVDPDPRLRLAQYVKRGKVEEVKTLLASGVVSVGQLTESGRTLPVEAVHARQLKMLDALLASGADPEQPCRDGSTLLHATAAWNYGAINQFRERLIKQGVDLDAADQNGLTALMKAARHGEDWVGLHQLVEAGADLAKRDTKGRTALDLALQSGRGGATRYLLSVNAPYTDPERVASAP